MRRILRPDAAQSQPADLSAKPDPTYPEPLHSGLISSVNVAILLLASGRGHRMGTVTPKVYLEIAGEPVIVRTLRRLTKVAKDAQIILAVHADDRARHLAPLLPRLEALA